MSRQLEHLQEAFRHVAEGEQRIAQQRARIADLERDGHDTVHSLALLAIFEETLRLMIAHRDMILREMGQSAS